jgi:hypothetical protein
MEMSEVNDARFVSLLGKGFYDAKTAVIKTRDSTVV